MLAIETKLYKIGDTVPQSGTYACVPCGYTEYFQAGAAFIPCLACLAGTQDGPEGYRDEGSEFWQFIG